MIHTGMYLLVEALELKLLMRADATRSSILETELC